MRRNIAKTIFLTPVFFYKKCISPLIGHHCIYTPSCSNYFVEAVDKHGIFKGFILGVTRLFRCSKLYLGGEDRVPEVFSFKHIRNQYIVFRRRKIKK